MLEGNIELWSGLGHAYAVSGNKAEALKILDHLQEVSTQSHIAPYDVAVIYAGLRENDEAFYRLIRAYDARSYTLAVYLNTDSQSDNLRSDARFMDHSVVSACRLSDCAYPQDAVVHQRAKSCQRSQGAGGVIVDAFEASAVLAAFLMNQRTEPKGFLHPFED